DEFPARTTAGDAVLLDVRHLAAPPYFSDVSLTVRRGEIVGLAGLVGAGRTSVGLALFGAIPSSGEVILGGQSLRARRPRDAMQAGLAYVTEDRANGGIFPLLSACDNVTITELGSLARAGVIARTREETAAASAARAVGLRSSGRQPAGSLSGGNQQKLLI